MTQEIKSRPLQNIVHNLSHDLNDLYQHEKKEIRQELQDKFKIAQKGLGSIVVGVGLLLMGWIGAVITLIIGLGEFMPFWEAGFIVTTTLLAGGTLAILRGQQKILKKS